MDFSVDFFCLFSQGKWPEKIHEKIHKKIHRRNQNTKIHQKFQGRGVLEELSSTNSSQAKPGFPENHFFGRFLAGGECFFLGGPVGFCGPFLGGGGSANHPPHQLWTKAIFGGVFRTSFSEGVAKTCSSTALARQLVHGPSNQTFLDLSLLESVWMLMNRMLLLRKKAGRHQVVYRHGHDSVFQWNY